MKTITRKYGAVATALALLAAVLVATSAAATGPGGDGLLGNDTTSVTTEETGSVELPGESGVDQLLQVDPIANTGALTYEMVWAPDATSPSGLDGITHGDGVAVSTGAIGDDGTFMVLLQIDSADDATEYRFDNAVPEGHTAELQPDGSVTFTDPDGNETAVIAPPWAYDDTGAEIPTSFALDGSTLVQTVEHQRAVYPVIADPCGWSWRGLLDCATVAAAVTLAAGACSTPPYAACGPTIVVAVSVYVAIQHPSPPPPPPPPTRTCRVWHYLHRNLCLQFY